MHARARTQFLPDTQIYDCIPVHIHGLHSFEDGNSAITKHTLGAINRHEEINARRTHRNVRLNTRATGSYDTMINRGYALIILATRFTDVVERNTFVSLSVNSLARSFVLAVQTIGLPNLLCTHSRNRFSAALSRRLKLPK